MTTREVLVAARALIATGDRWTKGVVARAADGRGVSALAPSAVRWCSIGALNKAEDRFGSRNERRTALRAAAGVVSIAKWNDAPERSHAEVLAAFDRAIEAAPT